MLVVNLLGPPEALIEGRPIQVDTRKAIALLAYLVIEKTATRDTLAAMLWAESSQERARATLRRTLSALRAATGNELIVADRNVVSLAGGVSSDVDTIRSELEATGGHGHGADEVCSRCIPHLRRATDLYRGEFLQGFSVKSSPEFEDWTRSVAESMKIRVGEMFNRLGTALAANGEYPAAISAVTHWIDLDALHEPAYRFLMLLHGWAGDRPGAIEAYQSCVAVLDQELGVPPLEETTELYEAILDEDLPPAPGARRRVKSAAPAPRSTPADLIDRESELQDLRQAVQATADGRGRLLALTGGTWMGKTRLLDEIASETPDQDRHVLIGRAFRMEQALPYGVVTPIIRSAVSRIQTSRAEMPEWSVAEMARLLPEMGPAPDETVPDQFGELRLFEAIFTAMAALGANKPLLVILDDVQWIDRSSAAVFSYLARRIAETPILLIVSARSGDALLPEIAEMLADAHETISVEPLATRHLLPLVGGDEKVAAELEARTGGVPLLVAEALAAEPGSSEAPPGMARYMEARLSEIGDLGRQVLTAAAVLNGMCDAGLLRETSGRSEEEVVEAVEELVGTGLLREVQESQELTFTLDAMERVTYDMTSLVRRRLLHRRAAVALAKRPHSREDVRSAAAVAGHYEAAADPNAADWYLIAGDVGRAVYANDSARQFYQASLALGTDRAAEARLALAELEMAAGRYEEARRQLTLARPDAEGEMLGLIEHRFGEVERLLGKFDRAEQHYRQAIESGASPVEVLSDWALLTKRTGRSDEAAALAEKAWLAAEEDDGTAQHSRVRNVLAVVSDDPHTALEHAEEAMRLAGDDDLLLMAALNNNALLLAGQGEAERAIPLLDRAIDIAARTGHRHREAALWNHLADLHHQAGREDAARLCLTRAVSLFADIDAGGFEPELWLLSRW